MTKSYAYTFFPNRNAVSSGVTRSAALPEVFPCHITAPQKDRVPCVGDYVLRSGSPRKNDNVIAKTMMTLDVDREPSSLDEFDYLETEVAEASERLRLAGVEHLLCTSYSHGRIKEGEFPYLGYRLVIPFTAPIEVGADRAVGALSRKYKTIALAVCSKYRLPGNIMALSQPWYVPSKPDNLIQPEYEYSEGEPLDWRLLEFAKSGRPKAEPKDFVPGFDHSDRAIDRMPAIVVGARHPRTITALSYIANTKVPALGEVASRHDDIVVPATHAVGRACTDLEVDEVMEVFEPWCEAMEGAYPRNGAEGWRGEVRRALSGAMGKAVQWEAERAAEREQSERQADSLTQKWSAERP